VYCPGFVTDIAVFDPAIEIVRSTHAGGQTLTEGVDHVLVNGTLALEQGEPAGVTPGVRCGAGEPLTAPETRARIGLRPFRDHRNY
jgi:hypothetical protein